MLIKVIALIAIIVISFIVGYRFCMLRYRVKDLMGCLDVLINLMNTGKLSDENQKFLDKLNKEFEKNKK